MSCPKSYVPRGGLWRSERPTYEADLVSATTNTTKPHLFTAIESDAGFDFRLKSSASMLITGPSSAQGERGAKCIQARSLGPKPPSTLSKPYTGPCRGSQSNCGRSLFMFPVHRKFRPATGQYIYVQLQINFLFPLSRYALINSDFF